jgi:hypothetical protein
MMKAPDKFSCEKLLKANELPGADILEIYAMRIATRCAAAKKTYT